jgi:uncharacterized membrane protein YccC
MEGSRTLNSRTMPTPNSSTNGAQLADKAAIGQGLRTAVVAFGGFAAGYWGVHRLDVAVYATFGGLALTGIADFGGVRRERFAANVGAALTGAILVTIGTWASAGSVMIGAITTFLVGAAVVFADLFGGSVSAGANAVILYYLVALGTPATLDALPSRLIGVALGGALAATASVALWPGGDGKQIVQLLASEADFISTRLSALSAGSTVGLPEEQGLSLRSRVDAASSRPHTPTAKGRALLYLLNDLERLDHLTATVARLGGEEFQGSLQHASRSLTWVASCLRSRSAPPFPMETESAARGVDLVSRISYTANLAIAHAAVAAGQPPRAGSRALDTTPSALLRHGLRRSSSNLRLDSVQLRNAIRTGAALGLAYLVARLTKVQHGFWVELATLTVVSSTARITGRRVVSAIAGTAVGIVLAIALIEGSGPNVSLYAWFTPFAIAVAIWARAAIGFGAGQAGFTIAVLMLFSLLKPAGWHIGLLRFEDVSIGVAVALVVSAVAWPGGARGVLARDLRDLRGAAASYLRSVVHNRALGVPLERDLTRQRDRATASALRTEAAFAQRLSEHPPGEEAALWAGRVSAASFNERRPPPAANRGQVPESRSPWAEQDLLPGSPAGRTSTIAKPPEVVASRAGDLTPWSAGGIATESDGKRLFRAKPRCRTGQVVAGLTEVGPMAVSRPG